MSFSLYSQISEPSTSMTVIRNRREEDFQEIQGVIQATSTQNDRQFNLPVPQGLNDKRRFLLIAPPEAFSPDDWFKTLEIVHKDLRYEVLRIDAMFLGNDVTHWEGILRLVGRNTP